MDQAVFNLVGSILVFAGFVIAFIAVLLMVFMSVRGRGRVRGGGAVIIGPFPIIFGTDKESVRVLLLLSIALIVLILIVMVLSHYVFK